MNLPEVRDLPWVEIGAPDDLNRVPAISSLHAGEREVIALGMQIPTAVVIIEERLGRTLAAALNLTFTGTLGILLRAKTEGWLRTSNPTSIVLTSLASACQLEPVWRCSD
jgi:hypothetical protein